jgi:hypothetical protein
MIPNLYAAQIKNRCAGCGYHKETVPARSLLCFWATSVLAISQIELAQKLKISQPVVSMAVRHWEHLAKRTNYWLKD